MDLICFNLCKEYFNKIVDSIVEYTVQSNQCRVYTIQYTNANTLICNISCISYSVYV